MSEESFFDEVLVTVSAGKGGPGASHFRREKYVPLGGPDGGDGGDGGSIVVEADRHLKTLLHFKRKRIFKAESGEAGSKSRSTGKRGEDLVLKVPLGTQVYSDKNGERTLLADLTESGERCTVAKGGRGGKGNAFFKSATNRAPEKAQPGEEGEESSVFLSLKMIADIGLIGFPNAGKSTLLSKLTRAKPKIGNYPFTTLHPNLGICSYGASSELILADIPGLIVGAHEGKGLGTNFLKHIERTKLLVHLIDCADPEILSSEDTDEMAGKIQDAISDIQSELSSFSGELASRHTVYALSKIDALPESIEMESLLKALPDKGVALSSVTGEGLEALKQLMAEQVRALT